MELPARYLLAVKLFLPKSERDDVIRELSEDLQSRVEETQATLGRPLTRADESALTDILRCWPAGTARADT